MDHPDRDTVLGDPRDRGRGLEGGEKGQGSWPRLSRRCPRGFRTAPRAAAAPSPRHEPEHWLLPLAAAGTAWMEKGRPWRWEVCCLTCAWSEGCKGTALNLENRETGGGFSKFVQTVITHHQAVSVTSHDQRTLDETDL